MQVLIVDDDGDDRDLFCESLTAVLPEANCILVKSGEEAIKFLRRPENAAQFIFLDIYMHGMDGKECLLKIKSMKQYIKVPVIMYSANNDEHQKAIYRKLGANGFINKTASLHDLKAELITLFKNLTHIIFLIALTVAQS
jgi:CheY-like chemotaxis protein